MTELQTDTQCPANTPKGLTVWVFVLTVVAFIVVVGYSIALYRFSETQPLRATAYEGDWISAPGTPAHAGYFRKRFDLTGEVKHAWIKIVAADAFETVSYTHLTLPTKA